MTLFLVLAAVAEEPHGSTPVASDPAAEAAHTAEAGDGAGGHAPSIMQVDPGLMIWTVVTFVVLLTVLRFTAWKPLMTSLDAREKRIRDAIEGAERARAEAERRLAEYERQLHEARDEAHKILEEGKADALKLKNDILAQARAESEEFKARARRELELATDQAKKELWEHATKLSTELAEKILRRSLDAADQRRLVEEVLEEYRSVRTSGTD